MWKLKYSTCPSTLKQPLRSHARGKMQTCRSPGKDNTRVTPSCALMFLAALNAKSFDCCAVRDTDMTKVNIGAGPCIKQMSSWVIYFFSPSPYFIYLLNYSFFLSERQTAVSLSPLPLSWIALPASEFAGPASCAVRQWLMLAFDNDAGRAGSGACLSF